MDSTATRPYIAADAPRSAAAQIADRARARWAGMAGRIGMGFCVAGFLLIFVAWNGAADKDFVQGQVPYLISGGVSGLGLIVIGGALLVAESNRRDRAVLERQLEELTHTVARLSAARPANGVAAAAPARSRVATADLVMTGRNSFHTPECRLVSGREPGDLVERDAAVDAGLAPCRVCNP